MYDFACQIAPGEKFPSLVFSSEPLDSTVLKYHPPMPEREKRTIG
jgi:hypothetical protein